MGPSARNLHRKIGAIIALFVLMLSATGLLLNHSSDLDLDQRYLTWGWLLEHYQLANVQPDVVYSVGGKIISQIDSEVFVDDEPVTHLDHLLVGGVMADDLMVLATNDALVLLSEDGEFIERMGSATGVPADIQQIGLLNALVVVQTNDGLLRSNALLDEWERIAVQEVAWSESITMPELVEKKLATYFHGRGITVERFVLDLHNGRLMRGFGSLLLDIIGVLLLVSSLSGFWLWARKKAPNKSNNKKT